MGMEAFKPSNILRLFKKKVQRDFQGHPQMDIIEESLDIAVSFAEAMEMGGMNAEIAAAGERLRRLLPILVEQEEEFEVEAP